MPDRAIECSAQRIGSGQGIDIDLRTDATGFADMTEIGEQAIGHINAGMGKAAKREAQGNARGGSIQAHTQKGVRFIFLRSTARGGELIGRKMYLTPFLSSLPCTRDYVFDHFHQPHLHAVIGVVDALDAVGLEFADFFRGNGAATACEDLDVRGAAFFQHVDHVLQVFDMAALVTGQRDCIGIFLQRGADHVLDAAIVAQVHHFGALRLDQAAHDVDGGVVAVEQAGGGDEAQGRATLINRGSLVGGQGFGRAAHTLASMITETTDCSAGLWLARTSISFR